MRSARGDLAAAIEDVGLRVVDVIRASDLANPSPCEGWTVRDVLSHLVATTSKFAAYARGDLRPRTPRGDQLGDDPRGAYWAVAARSRDSWAAAGDDLPDCRLPFGVFSAPDAAGINLFDVLVHGWDMARGAGLDYAAPDALVPPAFAIAQRLVTDEARASGQYRFLPMHLAEPTQWQRLLILAGRTPD